MAYSSIAPQVKMTPDGTGLVLIYQGKQYGFPNPETYHNYSQLNKQLGIPDNQKMTAEEQQYPAGDISELPSPEELRMTGERIMRGEVSGEDLGTYDPGTFINSLVEPILEELGDFEKRVKDFGLEGPFAFDEALAREASKEIVDPYYDQLLNEFVSGIEMRRQQGATEEKELLGTLSKSREYESGSLRRKIENAIDTTERGYEMSGMYQSGERRSAVGQTEVVGQEEMNRLSQTYGQRGKDISRQWQDELAQLGLRKQIGERELTTGRLEDIQTGVEARRREGAQQTEMERLQTTALPFAQRSEDALQRLLQL